MNNCTTTIIVKNHKHNWVHFEDGHVEKFCLFCDAIIPRKMEAK